jgi:hypothetical protein
MFCDKNNLYLCNVVTVWRHSNKSTRLRPSLKKQMPNLVLDSRVVSFKKLRYETNTAYSRKICIG